MAGYRVLCADLVSNTIREELEVKDLKWGHVLNAPGAMSGWVSLDDPKVTRTNLDPGATAIYIERGGLLVWGGPLWTARPNTSSRQLTLAAEGFWSYFRRRFIRSTSIYLATDQFAIVRSLIDNAQSVPGGDIGVDLGSETSAVLRDRIYYHYERKNLGEAIEQLAAVLNGFDFDIAVDWHTDGQTPLKTFRLHYPRRGGRIEGLIFNHNVAGVASLDSSVDATQMANQVDILGEGDGETRAIATRTDSSMFNRYPLLEEVLSFSSVSETDTIEDHAVAQLGRRKMPVETPELTMQADIWPGLGAYQVGDEGLLRADDGWVQLDAFHRIQGYEVTVSDEGQETVTPSFVSADAVVL